MCGCADVQMCEFFNATIQKRIRTFAHSQIRTLVFLLALCEKIKSMFRFHSFVTL